jgi:tetratricopeptide (TPR) repeat protein
VPWLFLFAVIAAAGAFGWRLMPRARSTAIPSVDTSQLDPEITALIEQTRAELARHVSDAELWARFGMVCEANNVLAPARDAYRQAIAMDSTNPRWHYRLAIVSVRLGDVALALREVEQTTALEPAFAPAYWRKGLWLIDEGRFAEAEAAFRKAIAIDPGDRSASLGLARALLHERQYQQAAEVLQKVLAEQPGHAYALQLLGTAYRQLGRHDEAAPALAAGVEGQMVWSDRWSEELTAFQRGYAVLLRSAQASIEQRDFPKAIDLYERARRSRPKDVTAANRLASAYMTVGRFDAALAVLNEIAPVDPERAETLVNLASALLNTGDAAGALRHASRAVQLNERSVVAQQTLGLVLWKTGQPQAALDAFDRAGRLDPGNAMADVWSGMVLAEIGRPADALHRFETAVKRAPMLVEGWLGIAMIEMARGSASAAEAALKHARELQPNHPQVRAGFQRLQELSQEQRPSERRVR